MIELTLVDSALRLGRQALDFLRADLTEEQLRQLPRLEAIARLGLEAEVARARIEAERARGGR